MVSSRRSRILVLTAVTLVVCFLVFAYPRSHQTVNKFASNVEEKTRLEAEVLKDKGKFQFHFVSCHNALHRQIITLITILPHTHITF